MRAAERRPGRGTAASAALVALAACALALLIPAAASAAPPQLWQSCETGSGAGQCDFPRGIAADSHNGHVFVADSFNHRIDELNPLGQFVKAWGWDVVASGPGNAGNGFEICVPENGDTCKAGSEGTGAGQFGSPQGVALDSAGNLYVVDHGLPSNRRVQKFSPTGQFLLMFGGEVNKTRSEEVGSTEAQRNLCTAASGDVCQKGSEGTGNGQFEFSEAVFGSFITIDDKGTEATTDDRVYVGDQNRIQVFDSGGDYLESLPLPGQTVQSLATDSAGDLYAVYGTAVHKLSPAGTPLSPETFEIPKLTPSETPGPTAVAIDAAGQVYVFGPTTSSVSSGFPRDPIIEFDPAGNIIDEFGKGEFDRSTGLATNLCAGSEAPGNLFVSNFGAESFLRAYGTNPNGCFRARTLPASDVEETAAALHGSVNPSGELSSECRFRYGTTTEYGATVACAESPAAIGSGTAPVPVHAQLGSLAKGTVYHFRLLAKVKGVAEAGSDEAFKTLGPPVISADQTVGSAYTEATLRALVNPEGFATTYHFEYTTQAEFEAHGFEGAQSTKELNVGNDRKEHAVLANLTGLTPGSAYRWRILATNSSGVATGQDHGVNTYRTFTPQTDCPNQAFRTAASAPLPDCRAYEMVSPVAKNGANIRSGLAGAGDPGGYVQAAADGERIAYAATFASFAGQPNSGTYNQYLAARQAGVGWSNQGIRPPVAGLAVLIREFMAFSPDLCSAWMYVHQTTPPSPDAPDGYPSLIRRQNCGAGAGGLESLVHSPPPLPPGTLYVDDNSVQGFSADSSHAFFTARAKLNDDAAEGTKAQIYDYDRTGGPLALVSVLPGGEAAASDSAVGGGPVGNLERAVSSDGSRVYWTASAFNGEGTIYLRLHPEQGIVSGECGKKGTKACTVPVSNTAISRYWTASADGSKALYGKGSPGASDEDLYEFDLGRYEAGEEASRLIAHHVLGVAGASADLSRVYFVSTDALLGAGQNSEGDEAQAGQANLYLAEGGGFSFIATLVAGDVGASEPGAEAVPYIVTSQGPYQRATRVSPDGARIAFNSRAPLSDYDNTGEEGKPAVEVYTYAAGGKLLCVSCSPSGARPSSTPEMRLPYAGLAQRSPTKVPAAAWIPTWEHALHASNVLSEGGGRLFFNSNDALLPRDTNGAQDVYEWEAPGVGRCNTEDPSYFSQNGGCLYLISSGESSEESEFWEASPDGRDVFFNTPSSLLPQDPGSIDLYDARVNGGFPQPAENPPCEGESCQSPPSAPNDPTPASAAFRGAGNLAPKTARKSCRKGKVKRRGRCVNRHRKAAKHKRKRDANANRRAKR